MEEDQDIQIHYETVVEAPMEAIVDLYKAGGWWRESSAWRNTISAMVRGSFCFLLAKTGEGRIVGMGRVISDGVSDAYIQDVVVHPQFRRHGIGRELVRRLTRYCVDHELAWIGLIAEPGTQSFYEALGYGPLNGYQPMLFGKRV